MKNITIIVPVHFIDDFHLEMLNNALQSTEDFHNDAVITIVCTPEVKDKLTNLSDKLDIKLLENNGPTDFCSQVNMGIDDCKTDWFSILEIDDEYTPSWLSSMHEHVKTHTDVDVFLPIVKDINLEGKFLSFTNESVWAYGFTNKQGYLDNEILMDYQNYQISGGLYKTEKIKENGKFKENFKLTFGYELLLRLTHNGMKIMTVPKIGYRHVNFRENSLFWNYKNKEKEKLTEDEVKFWLDTAKKEFFFKNKRDVKYVEN